MIEQCRAPDWKDFGGRNVDDGGSNEGAVGARIDRVDRNIRIRRKNAERRMLKPVCAFVANNRLQSRIAVRHRLRVLLEMSIEEFENLAAQVAAVAVAADADDGIDFVAGAVTRVEPFEAVDDAVVGA